MGRVILNASETWTGTVHFKCVWSCLQMFFLYIYLMHWSDSHRHLCLFRYSICHECWKAFFFFCICTCPQTFLLIPAAFFEQSLLPLKTFGVFFKSSRSHQIKTLMAGHPFKNPLKALVTFQAICFCVFLIHLVEKKNQQLL